MSWKQPVDTDIYNLEGCTAFERSVWFEIIMRANNKEMPYTFYHGNQRFSLTLKRGQMIFRVNQYAQEQGVGRKRVRKALAYLQKWYNRMHVEPKPYGLVITIDRYDDIVRMDNGRNNEGTTEGQRRDNGGTTSNKSVKNEKSENKGNLAKKFLDHFNRSLKKKNYYHRLTEEIKTLYSEFVGDDPTLSRHNELVRAVDNIRANYFYREQAKVDIWNFFAKIEKWKTLEPQADPDRLEDNISKLKPL